MNKTVFLLLILSISTMTFAQTVIKDSVQINPINTQVTNDPLIVFPDSVYGGGNDKAIIQNHQPLPDNLQSTINLPAGGKVTVKIIFSEAAASSKIDLLLRQPEQQTLLEYANWNIGYTWTSQQYAPGSNVEFGIYWYYNSWGTIYQGNEAGAVISQIAENKYQIGFEAAGDDWDCNELVIEVTIETYDLLVNIDPPTISVGETALITVQKQFYDGSTEDFPPDQLFEFGMMEGCTAGALVYGTDTSAYFSGVTQPMLFVAADSLENDEETVTIGVGLINQIPAHPVTNPVKKSEGKKDIQETRNSAVDKENGVSPDIIIISETCFDHNLVSTKKGFADLVVEGSSWCEDLDDCDEIKFPDIEFNVHENNWEGLGVCGNLHLAGTDFLESKNSHFREDVDIELCKEENSDDVHFYFDDDITINCVSDMCTANITAGQDILIDDVYSFPVGTSCKDKLFWIDLHKRYPYPTKIVTPAETYQSVYVIKSIWMKHEKVHRDHFLKVAGKFKSKYLAEIRDTKKKCSNFTNEEEAKSFFKKKAEEIIKDFYDDVKKEDDRISSGGDDGGDVIKFENDKIHKKVIDEYIQPLFDHWKLTNCVD